MLDYIARDIRHAYTIGYMPTDTVRDGRVRSTTRRRTSGRRLRERVTGTEGRAPRYWSQYVTQTSNALDLEPGVFTKSSARAIATSLKRSAERSRRRKGGAYQSAMSMLNFYINRAGRSLSPERRQLLERAKHELRKAFGRTSSR